MKLNGFAATDAALERESAHQDKRVRMRIVAVLVILLVTIVTSASPAGAEGNGQAIVGHLQVPAAAEMIASTCPYGDWVPATATICEDFYILYFLEAPASALREQPWILFVYHAIGIVEPDLYTPLYEVYGEIENPQGSFDTLKAAYAQVSGIIPMSDGSEVAVDLTWDMTQAELHYGGNDSAFNPTNGIERHYSDHCITLNQLAHQQWRSGAPGQFSGSVGGRDIGSLPYVLPVDPFTAVKSNFTFVLVPHQGCALQ